MLVNDITRSQAKTPVFKYALNFSANVRVDSKATLL